MYAVSMKWPWPPLRPKDFLGIAFIVAVLALSVFLMVRYPYFPQKSGNAGFGPDWDCKDTGSGEPVCVKKIGAAK